MRRNLPPLNALRAFEACARHSSFTRAADELCVTHGALSRQVAQLERHLKVKMYVRTRHGIALTTKGDRYYQALRRALDIIDRGTIEMHEMSEKKALRLRVPPTFAMRWLVPRIARFQAANRDIEVQIFTSHSAPDLVHDDWEACIQSDACRPKAAFQAPQVQSRRLFGETLMPVCSPTLINDHRMRGPGDLCEQTLISSLHRPNDWPAWLSIAGFSDFDADSGIKFETSDLSYQAAIDNAGVVIAQSAFVQDDLVKGRLVEPFTIRAKTDWAYYLVYSKERPKPLALEVFEQWLLEEAKRVDDLALS